ncbi:MAG: hypothetical protein HKN82_13245 [Akkermansiaceae bacterium]|nr:hypothetical protein [Akkermansiaceae bacterium]NNM28159.1 hypothetical protein [Akkermansiaceae bacterium]
MAALALGALLGVPSVAPAGQPEELPVLSIEATRRIAEETAAPLRRINFVGEFTVSRTGSTGFDQPAWILVSGSATPGDDYEAIPWQVTIPAGEASVSFPVTAFNDDVPEGIETVVARVSPCPPDGILAPCYGFAVDPPNDRATVFIREDGLTTATVHITRPDNGDSVPLGAPIPIEAVAIDLDGYLSEVQFRAGNTQIGMSAIYFFVAPEPGTPIHHSFEWDNAPPGDHVLTVRASPVGRPQIVSSPVRITVGPGGTNTPPLVNITSPAEGAAFPAGAAVPITVETRDPDGYVPTVEFFADGSKIGEVNMAFLVEPLPNQLQTFEFTWEDPMPGEHVLRARATDNGGAGRPSGPVRIVVAPQEPRPTVRVVARDAFAVEPQADEPPDTATFRLRRSGPPDGDLTVNYSMTGRAENGVDYELLSGSAVISAGSSSADVVVVPINDKALERLESVIIRLEPDPAYRLHHRRRAIAVIADRPWSHPHGPVCKHIGDGLVHFCFPAPGGEFCRLEESGNLGHWRTLCNLVAVDGSVHYVGEVQPGDLAKFCRLANGP